MRCIVTEFKLLEVCVMRKRLLYGHIAGGLLMLLSSGCLHANGHRPYGGGPQVIPGKIEMENYDVGPSGFAYVDVDKVNHGVDYRRKTEVDIEERGDASNGYGIGWTRASEWLKYTVNVQESGTYSIEFPVASNKRGGTFHIEADGINVTGQIAVPDTGGWTELKTIRVGGVQLEAGRRVLTVVMDTEGESGSIGDIDYMQFAPE